MNKHFVSITKELSLKPSISQKNSNLDVFHDHISIKKIKEIYPEIVPSSFKFKPATKGDIKNEIQSLNVKKSSTFGCIPVILKDCIDISLVHLTNSVYHSLQISVSPQKLKQEEVIPLSKRLDPLSEENNRPVSFLIYKQINSYMEDDFAKC